MRILHISADYPDPLVPSKTPAIRNLLDLVPEHEHRVWSLNRVGWRHGIAALGFGPGHRAVTYGAPPRGLLLQTRLARVAAFILEDAAAAGFRPDAVHAHKLSVDGLVGDFVAGELGVPLLLSLQGNSDLKILRARRDLLPTWRRIWHAAAVTFPFAPWTQTGVEALLGERSGPVVLLPCPLDREQIIAPAMAPSSVVRTAFHLAAYRNKNALTLAKATAMARREIPDLRLEIAGGGDAGAFATLVDAAQGPNPLPLNLAGPVPRNEISAFFNTAVCMAQPSLRESFGMVFIEALMAGCPVLVPQGCAIDGYFEDGRVGLTVPARDEVALAEALARLTREEAAFKERVFELQEGGGLDRFRQTAIGMTYRRALARLNENPKQQFSSEFCLE